MTSKENSINKNIKLCECGCGQPVKYDKYEPRRFIKGHDSKGKNNSRWKGGRYIDKSGYVLIWKPDHPYRNRHNYIFEHRSVMEEYLGRYLDPKESIHHINKRKGDNRIENLLLFSSHAKHKSYEQAMDLSGRICLRCKSSETYIQKHNNRPHWYNYKDSFICMKCYMQKW